MTLSNSDPFLLIDDESLQSALFHKRVGFPGDHLNAHNVRHTGGSQRWLNRDCVCDGGAPLSWPLKRTCFRENSGRRTSSCDVLPEAMLPLVSPMAATPEASRFCPMQEALADSLGLGTLHQPGWSSPKPQGNLKLFLPKPPSLPLPFPAYTCTLVWRCSFSFLIPSTFILYKHFSQAKTITAFDSQRTQIKIGISEKILEESS